MESPYHRKTVRVCEGKGGVSPNSLSMAFHLLLCTSPCVAQIKGILLTKTQIKLLHKGSFSKVHQSVGAERRGGEEMNRAWN